MTAKTYHAIRWTGTQFTATRCGAKTWSGDGLSTTNPARVTCAACLALLTPVAVVEPMPVVPTSVAAKKARVKSEPIQQQLI